MSSFFEGYYVCVSKVQQNLIGPDGTGRMVSRGHLVHTSQSTLLGKSKNYMKFAAHSVEEWKARNPKLPVVGGPHNNMKGVYVPKEAKPPEGDSGLGWSEESVEGSEPVE